MSDKWQPIETAPKDGTIVLVYRPNEIIVASGGMKKGWHTVPGWWHIKDPTHWMPLPAPPEDTHE